ncbi:MAG: hypothetical protein AB1813_08505 [Verrucomicrobiota bacterium]
MLGWLELHYYRPTGTWSFSQIHPHLLLIEVIISYLISLILLVIHRSWREVRLTIPH